MGEKRPAGKVVKPHLRRSLINTTAANENEMIQPFETKKEDCWYNYQDKAWTPSAKVSMDATFTSDPPRKNETIRSSIVEKHSYHVSRGICAVLHTDKKSDTNTRTSRTIYDIRANLGACGREKATAASNLPDTVAVKHSRHTKIIYSRDGVF